MKILIVNGAPNEWSLESSYRRGFEANGHTVVTFDFHQSVKRWERFGAIGATFNRFAPVESWIYKANRDLAVTALNVRPDVVILTAAMRVRASTIAFLKSAITAKIVLIWPDTLLNVPPEFVAAAPLVDLVAAHSKSAVDIFRRWGFESVCWLPFAGDIEMHGGVAAAAQPSFDLSFVGSYRPERERALRHALDSFPELRIGIWGPYWDRSSDTRIRQVASPKPAYGKDFARIVANSAINLNIIDDTNYPACNMRFFEIPAAGGLQLCSPCPEMEDTYLHGKDLFYHHTDCELQDVIRTCLSRPDVAKAVAANFFARVLLEDNYSMRARQLLEMISAR